MSLDRLRKAQEPKADQWATDFMVAFGGQRQSINAAEMKEWFAAAIEAGIHTQLSRIGKLERALGFISTEITESDIKKGRKLEGAQSIIQFVLTGYNDKSEWVERFRATLP